MKLRLLGSRQAACSKMGYQAYMHVCSKTVTPMFHSMHYDTSTFGLALRTSIHTVVLSAPAWVHNIERQLQAAAAAAHAPVLLLCCCCRLLLLQLPHCLCLPLLMQAC
jgi:hypothetical protein